MRNIHGLRDHPIYKSYYKMKSRCLNKNNLNYKHYGGRGIKICNQWINDFINFYDWSIKNGWKKGLTIDRINVNGDYDPSNCRWATMKVQSSNKRNSRYITVGGKTYTLTQLAELYKVPRSTLFYRIETGLCPKVAVNVEPQRGKKLVGEKNNAHKSSPNYDRRKQVLAYRENMDIVLDFNGVREAARFLGLFPSNIQDSIKRKSKTKGWQFEILYDPHFVSKSGVKY